MACQKCEKLSREVKELKERVERLEALAKNSEMITRAVADSFQRRTEAAEIIRQYAAR